MERETYIKTEEYKLKKKEEEKLLKDSSIIQNFENKYGSMEKVFKEAKLGYQFFNGKEYNDYIRETYKIQIQVYGDSCINLYSNARNEQMLKLIDNALAKNPQKVLVLTGAEHKYYFDDALKNRDDIKFINLLDILPLKEAKLSKNVMTFLEKGLAFGYYDETIDKDTIYTGALMPLVHGMNMDFSPEIIPVENIRKAQDVILEWEKESSDSAFLQFEKAWIKFLNEDYQETIKLYLNISERLDEFTLGNNIMLKTVFWRNLGWAYDMTKQREKALKAYNKCKEVCIEIGIDKEYGEYLYQKFEIEPYKKKK